MNTVPLEELLTAGESDRLEFKRDPDPDAVARAVTSFLNAGGGTVVVGVDERADVAPIGIDHPDEAAESLRQFLTERIFPRAPVTINPTTTSDRTRTCLFIDVPPGSEPPYFYRDQVYVRRGTRSEVATGHDISSLIAKRQTETIRWERRPALGLRLSDLDLDEVRRTAREAKQTRLTTLDAEDPDRVLEKLALVEEGQISNAAVVLFAKEPARLYPQTRVRVARFDTVEADRFSDNRVLEGHAFTLIERVWSFLTTHIPVVSELDAHNLRRSDRPAYPIFALREALMNALVHRDYAAYNGSISIALYPDRFEIWNPGTLPPGLSVRDLKAGSISRPHNPDMAYIFFLRGLVERWGTGTRRILDACEAAGLPEPKWEEIGGGIRLTLFLRKRPPFDEREINDRMQALLREMTPGSDITVGRYHQRYAADVTERSARSDLSRLVDLGFLRRVGRGPSTQYERTDLGESEP
jgi:ATP-dependent DNA helicase RecG